jgi:ribonucleoside-diphosphate reductase beta chain
MTTDTTPTLGTFSRVRAADKRLIRGTTDINQLMPLAHPWAWEHYLNGSANHWMPNEVPMTDDARAWRGGELSPDERLVVMRNLGFFASAESLIANNIFVATVRLITSPECRQAMLRQAIEEAIHNHMFVHIVDSLGLDDGEVYNMYREIPAVAAKDEFILRHTAALSDPAFALRTDDDVRTFLRNLVAQYVCMEGVFFYAGFVMMLSFYRRNQLTGIGQQFAYVMRDETVHMNLGLDMINGIRAENPGVWTPAFGAEVAEMIDEAYRLEVAYARDCLPRGVLGLTAGLFEDYVGYIADRRLERLGLPAKYGTPNPFEWLTTVVDLPKEKNFFESRVTEYRRDPLAW